MLFQSEIENFIGIMFFILFINIFFALDILFWCPLTTLPPRCVDVMFNQAYPLDESNLSIHYYLD